MSTQTVTYNGATRELTVTRRPRYTDGADLTYDDYVIVVNGTVIGATGWIADGAYSSWAPAPPTTAPTATSRPVRPPNRSASTP